MSTLADEAAPVPGLLNREYVPLPKSIHAPKGPTALLALGTFTPELQSPRPMAAADPRFNEFVILQAQNAGLFLGQIPHPVTGEKTINLRAAKSVLDSLEMLAAKTAGNLTEIEEKLLTTALANLRPLYEKSAG